MYEIGNGLSKREKLGIHAVVEDFCLEILAFAIEAAFTERGRKLPILERLRVKIELLKHLIRTEYELGVITEKTYLRIAEQLVEISKMTNGWIAYTQKGA